ncbi:PWWP domain-containing DNA repair factor 3A isoform X2 [Xenopus laevis]|uniref:PWWP domain-containing DNA repair factor 3A isoform X2 n=1 Tax=Xenopus laevis TaxID=8355 RepID=A0A8J0UYX8_XENLA|nr:PWWP domain-containing DNA repair factor 3A isoform X2 [Xenopus laevis]
MSSLGYVLCKWKSHFWPAKVLSKPSKQTNNSKMDVEILCLDELVHVQYKDTKPLVKVEVENIAAELASKSKNTDTPVEELTYRKALRIALDILNEASTAVSSVNNHCNNETNNTSSEDIVFKEMELTNGKNINQNASSTINRKKKPFESKRKRLNMKSEKMEHPALKSVKNEHDSSTNSTKKSPENKRMTLRSLKTNEGTVATKTELLGRPRLTGTVSSPTTSNTQMQGCAAICVQRKRTKSSEKPSRISQEHLDSSCTGPRSEVSSVGVKFKMASVSKGNLMNLSKKHSPKCMGAAKNCKATNTNGRVKKGAGKLKPQSKKPGLGIRPVTRLSKTCRDLLNCQTSSETENGMVSKCNIQDEQDFSPGLSSSDMELSSPTSSAQDNILPEEENLEDMELPSFLNHPDPVSFEPGIFVWCKYQKFPYWPSVEKAKEGYGIAVDWCNEMISDYRIRMGCSSFSGSFVEYCTAAISYPVRKELRFGKSRLFFPTVDTESEDSQTEVTSKSHLDRKLLPDRARAARDRANERLVDFIVKTKQAENHLMDILAGKKKSRWLHDFQVADRHTTCIETYLEDEEQVEYVVAYLQNVCEQMGCTAQKLMNKDPAAFIMDVLLPEAVIFAISAIDKINYEKAEKKYLNGPSVSKRERNLFEEQILKNKKSEKLGLKMESNEEQRE